MHLLCYEIFYFQKSLKWEMAWLIHHVNCLAVLSGHFVLRLFSSQNSNFTALKIAYKLKHGTHEELTL